MPEGKIITVRLDYKQMRLEKLREHLGALEYLASVQINPIQTMRESYPDAVPTERFITILDDKNLYRVEDRITNPNTFDSGFGGSPPSMLTYGTAELNMSEIKKWLAT